MIINLHEDLLRQIMGYLKTKDNVNFANSCKYINNISYLKFLTMNSYTDQFIFALNFCKHNNTLNKVTIYKNILNPQYYMPSKWPKSVLIYYSKILDVLSPNADKTENLKIYTTSTLGRIIKINWNKFKNLKNLYIFTDDICFEGIEVCTQLSNIFVFLVKKKKIKKGIRGL